MQEADLETVTQAVSPAALEQFERDFASTCGSMYAAAFSNRASAMEAAAFALEITSSDRVFTSPNSGVVAINGAWKVGAPVELIVVESKTGLIDLALLEERINRPMTRGREVLIPVHFGGKVVDMEKLDHLIKNPNTTVFECAPYSFRKKESNGSPVGSCHFSQMTFFALTKPGPFDLQEGAVLTCNDDELFQKLLLYRDNGIGLDGAEVVSGSFWLPNILAAIAHLQHAKAKVTKGESKPYLPLYRQPFFIEKYGNLKEQFPQMEKLYGQ